MRYAILSDIHSNLEALRAVLDALRGERIDAYVSLGDIVGYGADPIAAVRSVRALEPVVSTAGNHDWGLLGAMGLSYFNECARQAIEWTRTVIGPDEKEYLESLPLVTTRGDMTCVHGSLEDPASFQYVLDADDAYATMERMRTRIVFVGHSHVAGIFRGRKKGVDLIGTPSVRLEDGARYLVNAGSVGQPRDRDPRAACVVYDEEKALVEVRRVPYDIGAAQRKIREAGLPSFLADRLAEGI